MTSTTLREISALPATPAALADATVILIDYQNTYTRGVMELDGWAEALDEAARLLARARAEGATVIYVIHDAGAGSPYDVQQDIGRIHERVAAAPGEEVVVKTWQDAFAGTRLGELVDAAGHQNVVIAGFMTHMCVAFTAEGAFRRGYAATVVAAACATRALPSAAGSVTAAELHRAALTTIGDLHAVVVGSTAEPR